MASKRWRTVRSYSANSALRAASISGWACGAHTLLTHSLPRSCMPGGQKLTRCGQLGKLLAAGAVRIAIPAGAGWRARIASRR